jgi:predicted alpha/beta superfamily hydrolase
MTRSMLAIGALVGALAHPDALGAQVLAPRPVPTRNVESFTFQSPSMGVRYGINVALPAGYRPGTSTKYATLIATDGDAFFADVHEGAVHLEGIIEPLFIISIGVPREDGNDEHTRRRVYEFSPPDWDRTDVFGKAVTELCGSLKSPEGRCSGGASRFLHVIVNELLPLVTAKYPAIDRDELGLFGISAGGFFTTWAMFQPGVPFQKFLISSPAMAYGDGEAFRLEERFAAEHKDFPVSVYFGAGTLEAADGQFEGIGRIVSGMSHMTGKLASRNYPSLKLVTEYHPGMGHVDVLGTTVARGLRVLYGK